MIGFWLAPLVAAARVPRVAHETQQALLGHFPANGRLEAERMVSEKIAAANLGAMQVAATALQIGFAWQNAILNGRPDLALTLTATAPMALAKAASLPARQRVKANARRLIG